MFKKVLDKILDFTGFSRNSKYVKSYLNAANMHSGVFMAAIIVILEVWLIIRQHKKYIIPDVVDGLNYVNSLFNNTSYFWLLLFLGIAMFIYCIFYGKLTGSLKKTLVVIGVAAFGLLLCCFLPNEASIKSWIQAAAKHKALSSKALISNTLLITLYASIALFQISIIIGSLYQYKGGKKERLSSVVVISLFALSCLVFGIRVSYSDFYSSTGLQPKQFICFLMMAIYVGCLLVWKPYISVAILGTVFLGFYLLIKKNSGDVTLNYKGDITTFIIKDGVRVAIGDIGYINDSGEFVNVGTNLVQVVMKRSFLDGDELNYITFFISLTMVCISIYTQRINEAHKDEKLEYLATTDPLTGIYAYNHFLNLIAERIKDGAAYGEWAYVFIDIIGFKIYNDQKGFEAGNTFLRTVSKILTETFVDGLVSRQADDHFVGFVKAEGIEDTVKTINEKITALDRDIQPYILAGVYIYNGKKEETHRSVEKARYACTELKHNSLGRSVIFYDQKMHDNYRLKQYIVRHIDEAVENGYIKAYYQPVVWSKDRKLCGAEALARWIDPHYGYLNPGQFVGALEDAQTVYKLDFAILTIVCQNIRHNIDNNLPVFPVSINFSRMDFGVVDVAEKIDEIVKKYNIPKDLLHVEITESALQSDSDLLKKAVDSLHAKGYSLWLDDFGSGYSSFNVLKDYQFDVLKLDMQFLVGFESNEKAKVLIQSIVAMADQIGMKTLSEGVETKEEADFLKSISCGRLQGYLFGKPLPHEELLELVNNGTLPLSNKLQ